MEMVKWVKYSRSVGFSFKGRARRREFWWNFLFWTLVACACSLICIIAETLIYIILGYQASDIVASFGGVVQSVVGVGIYIGILLPIYVRRFHDIGKSGWVYLICLAGVPLCFIGGIALIIFLCKDSMPGDNRYGSNPKEVRY